jgi:hypothetical protein
MRDKVIPSSDKAANALCGIIDLIARLGQLEWDLAVDRLKNLPIPQDSTGSGPSAGRESEQSWGWACQNCVFG